MDILFDTRSIDFTNIVGTAIFDVKSRTTKYM